MGKFQLDLEQDHDLRVMPPLLENEKVDHLHRVLGTHQHLLSCLERRIVLIGQNANDINEYQENENEIIKIKTQVEIEKLRSITEKRKEEYVSEIRKFIRELENGETPW